mmetsp:Transcript_51362/g.135431  ORF Transcript_51362/g.135431 Transcript_51362/m.135431 type:complete len:317 (+) Transcript_51362:514-1464(+)
MEPRRPKIHAKNALPRRNRREQPIVHLHSGHHRQPLAPVPVLRKPQLPRVQVRRGPDHVAVPDAHGGVARDAPAGGVHAGHGLVDRRVAGARELAADPTHPGAVADLGEKHFKENLPPQYPRARESNHTRGSRPQKPIWSKTTPLPRAALHDRLELLPGHLQVFPGSHHLGQNLSPLLEAAVGKAALEGRNGDRPRRLGVRLGYGVRSVGVVNCLGQIVHRVPRRQHQKSGSHIGPTPHELVAQRGADEVGVRQPRAVTTIVPGAGHCPGVLLELRGRVGAVRAADGLPQLGRGLRRAGDAARLQGLSKFVKVNIT